MLDARPSDRPQPPSDLPVSNSREVQNGYTVGDVLRPLVGSVSIGPTYVYALCDDNGRAFYIGVTIDPQRRLDYHFGRGELLVRARLRNPGAHMRILEVHNDPDWALVRESRLIAEAAGPLLNRSPSKFTRRAHYLSLTDNETKPLDWLDKPAQ